MFKKEKDLAERSRALLKNKETKKLKADVRPLHRCLHDTITLIEFSLFLMGFLSCVEVIDIIAFIVAIKSLRISVVIQIGGDLNLRIGRRTILCSITTYRDDIRKDVVDAV